MPIRKRGKRVKMKIVNKWFKETVDYVDKNTELKIAIRNKVMSSITITGKVGELTYINLDVEFEDSGMYKCTGNISYQRRGANPISLLKILKTVKTEKEVIELIEESIAAANKCLLYLVVKERELNE